MRIDLLFSSFLLLIFILAEVSSTNSDSSASQPSSQPTKQPFGDPTSQPSSQPSYRPTIKTFAPTEIPSEVPSEEPSESPSIAPSAEPSERPTRFPTFRPNAYSVGPTLQPTTLKPSIAPSVKPSIRPSAAPTVASTRVPSEEPTYYPIVDPTEAPSMAPTRRPSKVPTLKPTTFHNPSSQPSSLPSGQPSQQPRGHPSGQPSSAPSMGSTNSTHTPTIATTVKPTPKPSIAPTFKPTMVPTTFAPTLAPSVIPSVLPTVIPTIETKKPTQRPSQPTSQPSTQPRGDPTSQPSSQPTQIPSTFGEAARVAISKPRWMAALQSALTASSQPSNVGHQSFYFEFDLSGFTPYSVYGSCSSWSSTLSGDVTNSLSLFKPESIEFSVLQNVDADAYRFSTASLACDDADTVTEILGLLSGVTQNSSLSHGISRSCNGHNWKVKSCSSSSRPALCVDCSDPCSTTAHCTTSAGSSALQAPFSIAPCVSESCSATAAGSAIRLLVVNYQNLEVAPDIQSLTIIPQKSSLTVNATLTADGTVYCGAFLKGTAVSSNLQTLIALQNAAATSVANLSVVHLSQLTPVTAYTVYCYSQTASGTKMSLAKTIATAVNETTACCKTLTVSLSATSAVENSAVLNILSLSLSSKPSRSAQISFASGSNLFWPNSFVVGSQFSTAADGSVALRSSLTSQSAGVYPFQVIVNSATPEYEVVYANNANASLHYSTFTLYSSTVQPPTPALLSAIFSSDGSYMTILFDSSTNRGGSSTSFTCSSLFSFSCDSVSRCLWVDDSTVTAYVSGGNICAEPLDLLNLASSARIKAKCPSGVCSGQASWTNVPMQSLIIQAPVTALSPNVVISAPTVIGSCDSLTIDVSGSSNSGGRAFKRNLLTVTPTQGNNGIGSIALQLYVAELNFTISPPTVIPQAVLPKGQAYTISVTLCNFLGQCSLASKNLWVRRSSVPVVKLPGQSPRYITRSSALSMYSSSSFVQCNGSSSASSLFYSWVVSSNGVQNVNLVSTSRDSSKLLLPAYSLTTSVLYTVTLTVTVSTTLASSSASATVFVQQGSIFASVVGGSTRSIRLNETAVIDASSSRDDDVQFVTGVAAGLWFSWQSFQLSPAQSVSCAALKTEESTYGDVLSVYAPVDTSLDTVCQFTVTVTDADATRSDSVSVVVSVLPALSPLMTLSANTQQSVINPSQVLRIYGQVFMPANTMGSASWSVSDDSVDLNTVAISPLSVSILPSNLPSLAAISLVLKANSLTSGVSLTFRLSCATAQSTVSSSIVVTVNSPPTPGVFSVSPTSGIELQDTFTFLASLWVDDQLPITYQFGYTASDGSFVLLRPKNEFTNSANQLTAGAQSSGYTVTCLAQIFDSLSANTTASSSVTVVSNSVLDASAIEAYVTAHIVAGSSADNVLQCGSIASYLLNIVDCSLTPDCASLNRQGCSQTASTCGSCLSSLFVGDFGDSNNPCISASEGGGAQVGQSCSVSTDCAGYGQCESGVCVMPNKNCPGNCSGRGLCGFVDKKGDTIDECGMDESTCTAVCSCEDGYALSSTCSVPDSELLIKQATRSIVINATANLLILQDPDAQSIQGWMSALNQASAQPDELTLQTATILLQVAQRILTYAQLEDFTRQNFDDLLSAVDHATLAFGRYGLVAPGFPGLNDEFSGGRRALSVHNTTKAGVDLSGETVKGIARLILQKMVAGEVATSVVRNRFRFVSQVLSKTFQGDTVNSDAVSNVVNVTMPVLPSEMVSGVRGDSISLNLDNTNQTDLQITLISMSSLLFDNVSMISNPMTVSMSASPCVGNRCRSNVTLHYGSDSLVTSNWVENVNTTCLEGVIVEQYYTCNNTYKLNTTCNGTAGVMYQECPFVNVDAICDAMAGDTPYNVGCNVTSYTSTNVTCDCPLSFQNDTSPSSVLSYSANSNSVSSDGEEWSMDDPSTSKSVSFVAMSRSTWDTFTETWVSAKDLNSETAVHGWKVIQTLGVFISIVIFIVIVAHQLDDRARMYGAGDMATRSETKVWQMLEDSIKAAMTRPNNQVMPSTLARQQRANQREQKMMKLQDRLFSLTKVNKDLALAEEYLPKVTHNMPIMEKISNEMKMHHRWFSLWYYYSEYFPRGLRVLALTTNIIIMLFFQSICYNLINPDDGSCQELHSEAACLRTRSNFFMHGTKCQWKGSSAYDGECSFVVPHDRINIILFVAMISALIGAPFAIAANYFIKHVLGAPTDVISHAKKNATPTSASSPRVKQMRQVIVHTQEDKLKPAAQDPVDKAALKEKRDMVKEMKKHRQNLASEAERLEFDGAWELDSTGDFRFSEHADQLRRVLADLRVVIQRERDEMELINKTTPDNAKEIGKKLLFLLQADLMPGVRGKALVIKGNRDFSATKPTTKTLQVIVWATLLLFNGLMLLYIYLFALNQTEDRQQSWFDTFIVWLVVEILITSTNACLITHVVIPSVTIGDATKIKLKLIEAIKKYQANIHKIVEGGNVPALVDENNDTIFDASKHFFVSARVAKNFSGLREAQIISMFRSPWPRQLYGEREYQTASYGLVSVIIRAFTVMLVFVLNSFLNLFVVFQDGIVELFTHILAYSVARFFLMLWNINPALTFFPLVAIGILIHFNYNTKGSYTREQLLRLRDLTRSFLPGSPRMRSPHKRSPKDGKYSPTMNTMGSYSAVDYEMRTLEDNNADEPTPESPLFSEAIKKILTGYSDDELDQMVNETEDSKLIVDRNGYDEENNYQMECKEDGNVDGLNLALPGGSSCDELDVPVRFARPKGTGLPSATNKRISPGMTASVSYSPGGQSLYNTISNKTNNSYNRAAGSIRSESGSDDVTFSKMHASNQAEDWSEGGNRSRTSLKMQHQLAPPAMHDKYQLSSDDYNGDSSDEFDDGISLLSTHHRLKVDRGNLGDYNHIENNNKNNSGRDGSESNGNGFKGVKVGILQQVQQKRRLNGVNDPFSEDDMEQPAVVSIPVTDKNKHSGGSSRWLLNLNFGATRLPSGKGK